FDGFVEVVIIFIAYVREEDVGRLAAEFECDWDQVLAGVLHDEAACRGLAGESNFGHARTGSKRFARFGAKAIHDIENTWRQEVCAQFSPNENAGGSLFSRFEDDAVAGGDRGGEFPGRHQDGKV